MNVNLLGRLFSMNGSLITLGIFVLLVFGTLYALFKVVTLLMRAIFLNIASHSKSNMK
jgi:hypothetical protein